MTRDELIAQLAAEAAPLGPRGSLAERRRAWASVLDSAGPGWVDPLIALLTAPPEPMPPVEPGAWGFAVEECLYRCARADPAGFLRRVGRDLRDPRARPALIGALASLRDPAAVPILEALAGRGDPSPGEAALLAHALGEIGGPGAGEALRRLRAKAPADGDLRAEIDAALGLVDLTAADRVALLGPPYARPEEG